MSKKFETDTPTIAEIRRLRSPNQRSCDLYINNLLNQEIRDLEKTLGAEKLRDKRENRNAEAPALEARIDEMKEEATQYRATFTFQDIGNKPFQDLVARHKPSKEQLEDEPESEWDADTFPPALIAASSFEPKMTLEDVIGKWENSEQIETGIWDEWSVGDNQLLFQTALIANTDRSAINFIDSSIAETLVSALSLTTAPNGESPTAGSTEAVTSGATTIETKL